MLDYAILGLLRRGPDYGYRLKAEMVRRGANAWDVNTGHVYYALKQLEKGGFVARVADPSGGAQGAKPRRRPQARYYEITERGRNRLQRWLSGPPRAPRSARFEIVVRWMTLGEDSLDDAVDQLRKESRIHERYLARLLSDRASRLNPAQTCCDLLAELAVEHAIAQARAHSAWIEHAMESLLARLAMTRAPEPGHRRGE